MIIVIDREQWEAHFNSKKRERETLPTPIWDKMPSLSPRRSLHPRVGRCVVEYCEGEDE